MKKNYSRLLLPLLLSSMALTGQAAEEDILINEDFSGPDYNLTALNGSATEKTINEWIFYYCYYQDGGAYNTAIKLEGIDSKRGYAISPTFKKDCNATLSFQYVSTTKKVTSLEVSVLNGGTFDGISETVTNYSIKSDMSGVFYDAHLKIYNAKSQTKIKFKKTSNNYLAIDNIIVKAAEAVTLSESADNSAKITETTADVTLTRTLTGGIWNTLCLPFDVNMTILERALGDGQDIQLRTLESYADGVITFKEVENVTAGTPFLIKLNTTKANPTFELVDLKEAEAGTASADGVSMVGVYNPTELADNEETMSVFLSTDGTLKKPGSGKTMNGLRAYFRIPKDIANARVNLNETGTSGIKNMTKTTVEDGRCFNLSGMRLREVPTAKGFYIVNGKKIVIK